jgi:hypothetical protein
MLKIKKSLFILFLFIDVIIYSQDIVDNEYSDDEYYDFGQSEGITVYKERPVDYAPKSTEANVLSALNGTLSSRIDFIENDLLEKAGFSHTGNVKYRKTNFSEKSISVLHGLTFILSLGLVPIPMKPFSQVEYGRLHNGEYYSFESVIYSSTLKDISPDVLSVMKIEYILQIEFCNGILVEKNKNYYTEDNISKLEMLILELPEFPESIKQIKERFLNIDLPKIRRAFERYNNPGEDSHTQKNQ